MSTNSTDAMAFEELVRGLMAGDFSRLAPLFADSSDGSPCPVIQWFDDGLFASQPEVLAEAFTCACFNGGTRIAEHLLAKGINPSGGIHTGLNAFHWAANRGQLETVAILIRNQAPLEMLNAYGGTVLDCTVWSAVHEPKPDHLRIIEAGANVRAAEYPSGDERVDAVLRRYGAVG